MNNYWIAVCVTAETQDQAIHVIAERLEHDEDYGFPYRVTYESMVEEYA